MINTYQASKILGITRKEVVKLMFDGYIPFKHVSGNYMAKEEDVRYYQANRAEGREKLLERVSDRSESFGRRLW